MGYASYDRPMRGDARAGAVGVGEVDISACGVCVRDVDAGEDIAVGVGGGGVSVLRTFDSGYVCMVQECGWLWLGDRQVYPVVAPHIQW